MAQAKTQAKLVKTSVVGIDPKQHLINVVMTDGTEFQILTTWGKEGETLKLDIDPKNHPAWQEKGQNIVASTSERVTKFNNKFGNFGFVTSEKKDEVAGEKKDEETDAA